MWLLLDFVYLCIFVYICVYLYIFVYICIYLCIFVSTVLRWQSSSGGKTSFPANFFRSAQTFHSVGASTQEWRSEAWRATWQAATTRSSPQRRLSIPRMLIPWWALPRKLQMHDLSRQVVSTLQHLLRLDPGCRLVDFGAGACKLASQLYRSKFDWYLLYGVEE